MTVKEKFYEWLKKNTKTYQDQHGHKSYGHTEHLYLEDAYRAGRRDALREAGAKQPPIEGGGDCEVNIDIKGFLQRRIMGYHWEVSDCQDGEYGHHVTILKVVSE